MRLHEQLGGPEPDDEVEELLSSWRYVVDVDGLSCPECGETTSDGEYCGECASERASYYHPDEGGENG